MRKIILFCILLYSVQCMSQDHTITMHLKTSAGMGKDGRQHILLCEYYGEKASIVDSAFTDENGNGVFVVDNSTPAGIFKIAINRNQEFDLIYKNENIEVSTWTHAPADSLQVIKSEENELYYGFLRFDQKVRLKLELLSQLVTFYPDQDKFYKEAVKQFTQIQNDRNGHIDDLVKNKPNAYATKIIRRQKTPFVDPLFTEIQKDKFIKENFFKEFDFNDLDLFRSNIYTNKVVQYLTLYSGPKMTQPEMEQEFIKAVDVIMKNLEGKDDAYEFILEYLVGGFEKYHFDAVLDHVAVTYGGRGSCEGDDKKSTLEKRLESYKKFAVGSDVPIFNIPDINGNEIYLADLNYDKVILVFWATWCTHCKEMMPELKKLYDEQGAETKWEVVAISLDTDGDAWRKFIEEGDYNWINCSELLGWESSLAEKYNIYATPTMFVLDKDKKITAKPITITSLKGNL